MVLPQEHPDLAEVRGGAELLQELRCLLSLYSNTPKSKAPLTLATFV